MMMAGNALGRGFESLIPTDLIDEEFDPTLEEEAKAGTLTEIKIDDLVRDEGQPRKEFNEEALAALAASIKEHGVLQPIVVTREGKKYKIVAGERRWRASKIAGLAKVPAIVRTLDAQNRLELSIIENAQREDLNAIELATAYAKLKAQFNLSTEEIAKRVGKSESSVINTMRLLNLPDEAKHAMQEHNLKEGVMRPLVSADVETIEEALPHIVADEWTARKVEAFVREHKKASSMKAVKKSAYDKQESRLSEKYGVRVRVRGRTVSFGCKSEAELEDLLKKLQKYGG